MEEDKKKNLPPPPPPVKKVAEDNVKQPGKFWLNNEAYEPPKAIDLEEVVLGALMIDRKACDEVLTYMLPDVFFLDKHRRVFRAILNQFEQARPIDLLTVSNALKQSGEWEIVGGDYYLIQLTQKVSSGAHTDEHCRIIIQQYVLRELIQNSSNTIKQSYSNKPDIFDIMESIELRLNKIQDVALRKGAIKELSPEDELRERVRKQRLGLPTGIPTGVKEFDDWYGGWQFRDLVILASRPGMGKTSVMLSAAGYQAEQGFPVAIYSLEMAKIDLYYRLASKETGIGYQEIKFGRVSDEEFERVLQAIKHIRESDKLFIYDTQDCKNTLEVILSMIRKDVKERGVMAVYIDYAQLINLVESTGNDTQDLKRVTRSLKGIANELNIPVIAFAQLGRDVEKRKGHRPTLSDLKQSGSFEEDADLVMFLLRQAYYQEQEMKPGDPPLPAEVRGELELITGKGRSSGLRNLMTFLDFNEYRWSSWNDRN